MKAHWQYLRYVLRHKWHVFVGCYKLGVPLHQAILHDLSKFSPAEWFAYVDWFYGAKYDDTEVDRALGLGIVLKSRADMKCAFDRAWNHHQKVNPHHWQFWCLITDSDEPRLVALRMPNRFAHEMVADWYGAGRAINGRNDIKGWYEKNREKIVLEASTRWLVDQLVEEASHFS